MSTFVNRPPSTVHRALRAYFYSGWAFFVPYLAAYLLNAWTKWPVNPASSGEEIVKGMGAGVGAGGMEQGARIWVPCLLHIYWALHAIHLILGATAVRSWLRQTSLPLSPFSLLQKAAPWFCLMLLFYIPGIYLEWPSDPWEHLRRINEWHVLDQVTAHSAWKKSSYFLPYSFTGHTYGLSQLSWLNYYYTGICLLLSWQYYRLARAVGLGERASFVFVLLNALTFGNNIFSFYRYYGLSSSILAQIGAVALTRLAIEALRGSTEKGAIENGRQSFSSLFPSSQALLLQGASGLALCALTAFNHIQGLGIAGLGVFAVAVWRLIEWKRSMIFWLAGAAVILSVATVLWFPRHPALDEIYRPQGWLTAWYGFNLFSADSPTLERAWQILGAFGVANLGLALWLIARRNHVAGWLTLMPVVLLALPCFALPFAHTVAANAPAENIVIFHRMLFAVPMGLGMVTALSFIQPSLFASTEPIASSSPSPHVAAIRQPPPYHSVFAYSFSAALLFALLLSPGTKGYNRFWQSVQITPDDLQLKHMASLWSPSRVADADGENTLVVSEPLGNQIKSVFFPVRTSEIFRQIHSTLAADKLEQQLDSIRLLAFELPLPRVNARPTLPPPPDWASISLPDRNRKRDNRLIANPTSSASSWLTRAGNDLEFSPVSDGSTVVSTQPGAATYAFASPLIEIDRSKRYLLSTALRQLGSHLAINYLAVAWYDSDKRLLESNSPSPRGAGMPLGWANGTYSYYGLAGQPGTPDWTTYTIEFGWGESAFIPLNAAYFRIGVLLNHNGAAEARIELKNMPLFEKPDYTQAVYALPTSLNLCSPLSHTAVLSGHWPPQKAAADHVGLPELRSAINERLYDRVSTSSAPGGG